MTMPIDTRNRMPWPHQVLLIACCCLISSASIAGSNTDVRINTKIDPAADSRAVEGQTTQEKAEATTISKREVEDESGWNIEKKLVGWHGMLSGQVESLGEAADKYFDQDIVFEEINQTSVRLRLDLEYDERDGVDFRPKIDIKWVLPAAKRKLSLLLTSEDQLDTDSGNLGNPLEGVDDRGSIALDYAIRDNEHLRTSLSGGLRSDQVYARLNLRRNFGLTSHVKSRIRNQLTYFSKDGLENDFRFDVDVPFGRKLPDTREFSELTVGGERRPWLFRSASQVRWFDEKESILFRQRFSFFTRASRRSLIAYEVIGHGCTNPNIIDDTENCQKYNLQLRYKRVTKYPWLSFLVQPVASFPEWNDFQFTPEIRLRAEIWFGKGQRVQRHGPVRF